VRERKPRNLEEFLGAVSGLALSLPTGVALAQSSLPNPPCRANVLFFSVTIDSPARMRGALSLGGFAGRCAAAAVLYGLGVALLPRGFARFLG
jgi:hypothetical protein